MLFIIYIYIHVASTIHTGKIDENLEMPAAGNGMCFLNCMLLLLTSTLVLDKLLCDYYSCLCVLEARPRTQEMSCHLPLPTSHFPLPTSHFQLCKQKMH